MNWIKPPAVKIKQPGFSADAGSDAMVPISIKAHPKTWTAWWTLTINKWAPMILPILTFAVSVVAAVAAVVAAVGKK